MLYVQIFGRGLRVNPGYSDCLFLDHSGTSLKLGYPTDIHHDVLDDGKERRCISGPKLAEPKLCTQCHFLKPPKTPVCPNCGHEAKHGPREVDTAMGQLVELDAYRKPRRRRDFTPSSAVIFYAELKGMCPRAPLQGRMGGGPVQGTLWRLAAEVVERQRPDSPKRLHRQLGEVQMDRPTESAGQSQCLTP
jgi:superfamily II DNA or RNA helicase